MQQSPEMLSVFLIQMHERYKLYFAEWLANKFRLITDTLCATIL